MAQIINGGIARMGDRISEVVGGGIGAAKHAARRAENAAGDLLYNTSRTIRRHPAKAILTSTGAAFAAGLLVGRFMLRRR